MNIKELLELRVSHNDNVGSMREFLKFVLLGFAVDRIDLREYKDWRWSYYSALHDAGVISVLSGSDIPDDQREKADGLLYTLIKYVFDDRHE